MARTRGQKGYFDFSRGIITEGSKLTYEENSLLDSMNMSFTPGKPLKKRLGLFSGGSDSVEIEDTGESGFPIPANYNPTIVGKWLWKNAGGNGGLDIVVFLANNVLVGMSGLSERFKIDLDLVDLNDPDDLGKPPSGTFSNFFSAKFAAIGQSLYIILNGFRLYKVNFPNLGGTGSFSSPEVSIIPVQYRDFGDASTIPNEVSLPIQDGAADIWNSGQFAGQRYRAIYDLFNRGWTHLFNNLFQSRWSIQDSMNDIYQPAGGGGSLGSGSFFDQLFGGGGTATTPTNPPTFYRSYIGKYLNKSIIPALGVGPSISRLEGVGYKQNRAWDVDPYRTTNFGSGSAAKGHVICDIHRANARAFGMWKLLQQGNDGDLGQGFISGPAPDKLTSICTFYGRLVMGSAAGKLYLSQLHKDSANDYAGKCYQENDPTDKDFNEVLATDGTVIDIGDAGEITALVPFSGSLLVIAANGLWTVSGSDNSYDITKIAISKIYNEGLSDEESPVTFPGGVAFFSESGIIQVTRDPTVGTLNAQNITDSTIKSLYEEVYKDQSVSAVGYDARNSRVEWCFNGGDVLQLDVRTGGFFRHHYPETVDMIIQRPDSFVSATDEVVTVGGVPVTVDSEEVTVSVETTSAAPETGLIYLQISITGIGLGYQSTDYRRMYLANENLVDLGTEEYEAYAVAGFDTFNDPSADKDIDRLFIWFEITEDGATLSGGGYELDNQSACNLSTRWEWATSEAANRWYNHGNVYKLPTYYVVDPGPPVVFDPGYDVTSTCVDLLGQGKAVTFRFDAEPGKHMSIWGWSVIASSEVNP